MRLKIILLMSLLLSSNLFAADIDKSALRLAIEDLAKTYPDRYTRADEFLKRLDAAANQADFAALQRESLIANPLVSAQPIVFVTRNQYKPDHHNTETIFQTGEVNTGSYQGGGALKVIDFAKGGAVTTLVDAGKDGLARDPDVSFDGKKILFSMRTNILDNYHLYEVNSNASGLKQLTSAKGVFDIDPIYLPDGGIIFSSSREPKYCMCNKHIMANLFRMEADGANIIQIGKSTLFEGHSNLMPDGRIMYDRWEYVDRNFGDAQGLWTVNPDGTRHAVYYGNNTKSPGAKLEGRMLSNELCLCIFGSCHDRPWGALALIDRSKGVDGKGPVIRTWPTKAIKQVDIGDFDSFKRFSPRYEDPYPLSDKYFLVSRSTGNGEEMAIALVDIFGNEVELHREMPGCYDPMPLAPRKRPPVIPLARKYDNSPGKFYIQDVYVGTHMQGVKRGDVKYLRVVESGEKRSWTPSNWQGQIGFAPGTQWPALNWADLGNKRILGTVAVEKDGSVYFECPAEAFVYFQLLDARGRLIQTMRSGTIIQPGELQGCIGCHENRVSQSPVNNNPIALKKPACKLDGWYGTPRFFNYTKEIQPVFDRNCVKCHDYGKPAGQKLNLSGDRSYIFSASYQDLMHTRIANCLGTGAAPIVQPYEWGSNKSKLIEVLDKGHYKVKLTDEEMARLAAWIDINGPYYSTYDCAYPENFTGRCPLSDGQLSRLARLAGVNLRDISDYGNHRDARVSFDRPELSPCLTKLQKDSPEYKEAVAIIQAGQAQLKTKPEADREGFVPADYAVKRQKFYEERLAQEKKIRAAIIKGIKVYDE